MHFPLRVDLIFPGMTNILGGEAIDLVPKLWKEGDFIAHNNLFENVAPEASGKA